MIAKRESCRPALMSYRQALTRALEPAPSDGERKRNVVGALFATLQADTVPAEVAAARFATWGRLFADRPALEMELAADYWMMGEFMAAVPGNRVFAPKPIEMAQLADKAREVLQAEISTIDRILAAEVETSDGRDAA